MRWPPLQLDPVAQGLPCGSGAYPSAKRNPLHGVVGGWRTLYGVGECEGGGVGVFNLFVSRLSRAPLGAAGVEILFCSRRSDSHYGHANINPRRSPFTPHAPIFSGDCFCPIAPFSAA